ncbi:MAG TPA: hypothetical protein VES73_03840, partial [Lamprocystis sp. (in: g-proteobacteria)]|nr:hypothetical protein [Lamprocystis sp. (in: g-proteobacteria)]
MSDPTTVLQDKIKLRTYVCQDGSTSGVECDTPNIDFFGRHQQKAELLTNLRAPDRHEVLVVQGERRMG